MKKYILFISLCCFALLRLEASEKVKSCAPQDSVWMDKGWEKLKTFEMPDINIPNIDMPSLDFNFEVDSNQILAWKENFKNMENLDFSDLDNSLKNLDKELQETEEGLEFKYNWGDRNKFSIEQKGKTPIIENKTFSNISEVVFSHKYGNIIVKESRSKDVELEIQYHNQNKSINQEKLVQISSKDGLLSINSKSSSINPIHFVISIPRKAKLNVDLKYGRLKMNEFYAPFSADLSFSTFDAESFSGVKPVIKDKYGKVSINKLEDADLLTSYSKVVINKANKLDISGDYTDYILDDVQSISTKGSSLAGELKIGSLGEMNGKFNYTEISIENLQSTLSAECNYSDITINSISQNTSINIKGNYSNVILNIPDNVGASFNVALTHGDFDISKKHTVKYTEQAETSFSRVKKGQIGSKKSTATINISSNYADVKIK